MLIVDDDAPFGASAKQKLSPALGVELTLPFLFRLAQAVLGFPPEDLDVEAGPRGPFLHPAIARDLENFVGKVVLRDEEARYDDLVVRILPCLHELKRWLVGGEWRERESERLVRVFAAAVEHDGAIRGSCIAERWKLSGAVPGRVELDDTLTRLRQANHLRHRAIDFLGGRGLLPTPRVRVSGVRGARPQKTAHENEVIELLVDRGARIDEGDGALAIAHVDSTDHDADREFFDQLIGIGARVDARAPEGWTALMFAAHRGHEGNVKFLLSRGADPQLTDRNGRTALALAQAARQVQLASGRGVASAAKLDKTIALLSKGNDRT